MITFNQFLAEAKKPFRPNFRSWVFVPGFDGLYLRYGQRHIEKVTYQGVLDIATVEVEEALRGKGTFKAFILSLQAFHPELHLYVENAHPQFGAGLLRMGFKRVDDESIHEIASNYFMPSKAEPKG